MNQTTFFGEHSLTLDEKNRIAMPTVWRDSVKRTHGISLVLTYNPFEKQGLWLYTYQEWQRVSQEVEKLPNSLERTRILQQKLLHSSSILDMDSNGRLILPSTYRSAADIDKKAVLVGAGKKFELWSEQAHHALIQRTLSDQDMAGLEDLRL